MLHKTVKLALGSIAVGCAVFGLKLAAWKLTGSAALFSDAMESVVNVAAAAIAAGALWLSVKPADANHPYGHTKAEHLAAVAEGVLVVLAALAILREAYKGWLDPQPLEAPALGLAITALASVINGAWAWVLVRYGRRWRATALVADGRHLQADVITSAGVLAGVALVAWTGWLFLDPLIAALVAINVLWIGWGLVRESLGGLMDEAVAPEVRERVEAVIAEHGDGAIEAHDLRTRQAGRRTFVEFHLVVPGRMSVERAHEVCDRIEGALKNEVEGSAVTIHVEPEHKAKQDDDALTL